MRTSNLYVPSGISEEAQTQRARSIIASGLAEAANVHYHKYGETCDEQCRSYPSGDRIVTNSSADGVGEPGQSSVGGSEDDGPGVHGDD